MGRILKHGVSAIAVVAIAGGVWYAYQSGDGGAESVAPLITVSGGPDKIAPKDPGGMKVPHRDKEVYSRFETTSGLKKDRMEKQSSKARNSADLPPPPPSMTSPLYGKKPGQDPDAKSVTKTSAGRSATGAIGQTGGAKGASPVVKAAPKTDPKSAPTKKAQPKAKRPTYRSKSNPVRTVPHRTSRSATRKSSNPKANSGGVPKYVPRKGPLPRTTAGLIGPYRIQIGSYRSGDYAMRRWFQLKSRHRDLLGNLVVVIERVNLGKRGYVYRLQAGPLENRGQVRGLCHLLGKRRIACSLVRG